MTFANLVAADGGARRGVGPVARRRSPRSSSPRVVGHRLRRDLRPQRGHLLPDDHARVQRARLLLLQPGHAAVGLRRRQQPRPARAGRQPRARPGRRSTTRRSSSSVLVFLALRYISRTPFGLSLQGLRDEPSRMRALGFNVTRHRMLAFALAAFVAGIAGVLSRLVQPPHLARLDQPRADDQHPDHRRHRRAVPARGRLGRRARLRPARQLLARMDARDRQRPGRGAVQHDHRDRLPDHRARSPPAASSASGRTVSERRQAREIAPQDRGPEGRPAASTVK